MHYRDAGKIGVYYSFQVESDLFASVGGGGGVLLLLMDLFMELLCSFFLFDANTNESLILTLTFESSDHESCCFLFFNVVSFLSGAYCIDVAMVI